MVTQDSRVWTKKGKWRISYKQELFKIRSSKVDSKRTENTAQHIVLMSRVMVDIFTEDFKNFLAFLQSQVTRTRTQLEMSNISVPVKKFGTSRSLSPRPPLRTGALCQRSIHLSSFAKSKKPLGTVSLQAKNSQCAPHVCSCRCQVQAYLGLFGENQM